MDAVLLLLGALMVNQWIASLDQGHYGKRGFAEQIEAWTAHSNAPGFWNDALEWIADRGSVFAPLVAVVVLSTGVLLLLLVARGPSALVASGFLFALWVSQWGISGVWGYQFLFPAGFGLVAGLATLPQTLHGRWRDRLVGSRFFGDLGMVWRVVVAGVVALVFWYLADTAHAGIGRFPSAADESAIAIGLLLVGLALLDRIRPSRAVSSPVAPGWWDAMILLIGSMMCIQVMADLVTGWYNRAGYSAIVGQYADTSGAPGWWRDGLRFVADHPGVFWPQQAAFEIAIAVLLSVLLLRNPTLLLTFAFFFVLMYSEFDVSADGSPARSAPRTWLWEMLFLVVVCLIIAAATAPRFLRATTWKDRVFGPPFYPGWSMAARLGFAVAGGLALWWFGIATEFFGTQYRTISWRGAVFFGGALVVLAFVERYRSEPHRPAYGSRDG